MSKFYGRLPNLFWAFLSVIFSINYSIAQDAVATVSIQPGTPSVAVVEGKFQAQGVHRELRFLTQFGHISKLDQRMSGIELFSERGEKVSAHQVAPGRFVAESDFNSWKYRVDITVSKERFASAHLTWGDNDGALIALQDLLPQGLNTARITVAVPDGWGLFSSEISSSKGVYDLKDVERTVFHAGRSLRATPIRSPGSEVMMLVSGEWHFSDAEAAEMARSIFTAYTELFGKLPAPRVQIAIRPFPIQVPRGQWEAGSRGTGVTIISSDMPFKSQSIQRLHEQLRHEIFHLWIPNAVSLTGNFDWFYEGFALYNSLKTGVAVNRISFDDFLDTLSRAHGIEAAQSERGSLIEESEGRWNGSNTLVYARGMLTAFVADIAMIKASKGKRSVAEVLKKVFVENRGDIPRNGNDAIISVLNSYKELKPMVDRSIAGSQPIDWNEQLQGSGLEMATRDQMTRIKVVDKPSGREREVLDRLGYNNWRKLPRVDK